MKKIAVILSGSGVYDGSEIHEAVLTLMNIEKAGAQYQCFAPDMDQLHVINHLTGEVAQGQVRNVLVESARIARGNVKPVTELAVADFDGVILPGGFGAAKNLSNFAIEGAQCDVHPDVYAACTAFAQAKKPAGYMCIAPTMIPRIYGEGCQLTIGNDAGVAEQVMTMGGVHVCCPVNELIVDQVNKVVSTPAYMLAGSILEANSGIEKLVQQVISMA